MSINKERVFVNKLAQNIQLSLLLGLALTNVAVAHITDQNIHGKLHVGGIVNSGNTKTSNLNSKFTLEYENKSWDNDLSLEHQLSKDDKVTTGNRAIIALAARKIVSQNGYIFVDGSGKYDQFGTYDLSFKEAIGFGWFLYHSKITKLTFELGPGATHNKTSDSSLYHNQLVGKAASKFVKTLSDKIEYSQTLSTFIGHQNKFVQWKHGLELSVSKRLSLEVAFSLEYNSYIPTKSKNKKHFDTATKFSITYDFV